MDEMETRIFYGPRQSGKTKLLIKEAILQFAKYCADPKIEAKPVIATFNAFAAQALERELKAKGITGIEIVEFDRLIDGNRLGSYDRTKRKVFIDEIQACVETSLLRKNCQLAFMTATEEEMDFLPELKKKTENSHLRKKVFENLNRMEGEDNA